MVIDLKNEQLLKLYPDAAEALGKLCNTEPPSRSSMYRKAKSGLGTVVVGGASYTSFEEILRHITRTTEQRGITPKETIRETSAQRSVRLDATRRRLKAHGINCDAKIND